ncbi:hypothetical protein BDB01DRAFT_783959 [Pilobolus umbonatus]|nr:hypothetical protein BDB01DRAFT_783959 [Pilobolus umbonatus]
MELASLSLYILSDGLSLLSGGYLMAFFCFSDGFSLLFWWLSDGKLILKWLYHNPFNLLWVSGGLLMIILYLAMHFNLIDPKKSKSLYSKV